MQRNVYLDLHSLLFDLFGANQTGKSVFILYLANLVGIIVGHFELKTPRLCVGDVQRRCLEPCPYLIDIVDLQHVGPAELQVLDLRAVLKKVNRK